MSDLTRPIIGIENRTGQEVFDIMVDRFRPFAAPPPSASEDRERDGREALANAGKAEWIFATEVPLPKLADRQFKLGQRVEKISGSSWCGMVVGFYATRLTPIGYAVESEREPGSVQIYPEKALRAALGKGDYTGGRGRG